MTQLLCMLEMRRTVTCKAQIVAIQYVIMRNMLLMYITITAILPNMGRLV